MTDEDKRQIVAALNRRYGTTVDLEVLERCVSLGFTTWLDLARDVPGFMRPVLEHLGELEAIDRRTSPRARGAFLVMRYRELIGYSRGRRIVTVAARCPTLAAALWRARREGAWVWIARAGAPANVAVTRAAKSAS